MDKATRDQLITRLSPTEREDFRRVLELMRLHAQDAVAHGVSTRQVLTAQADTLSPALRAALDAVVARDVMGPPVGTSPPDFHLKRLGSDQRVRLSSFRGQQPVALVFGSYT